MDSPIDRENKIKLLLSKQRDFMTSKELAKSLKISTKTVYRLIKKINDEFPEGNLIDSEKGRGYKLDYEKFIVHSKKLNVASIDISPTERQNNVMEELLLSSPKSFKITDLYDQYYVGDSAISNDEKIIAERIKRFELELVRKNRTLAIEGKEVSIRKAIAELVQRLNIIDIEQIKSSEGLNFNRYDVLFVTDQLKIIESDLKSNIPYPYNVNIFSHLYILISRSRRINHQIIDEKLNSEQLRFLDNDRRVRDISTEIIRNVESYLGAKMPVSEIYFLYQYLVSSRMETVSDKNQTFSDEVENITLYYLENVGLRLNIKVNTETIFVDLANHIKPMLNRLKNRISVRNSLLDQIRLTYESIFNFVSEVSIEVSDKFNLPSLTQDEIGFITLYFARIIETHQLPIQTLIMCTTGVGTSELLKAKIGKKFPELEVVDVISTRNYRTVLETSPGIELILTTVGIHDELPVNYLIVSGMLTSDDQSRIQEKIEEIYNER